MNTHSRRLAGAVLGIGLLGGDISRQGYWPSYGGGPGLVFLVDEFRRRLREAGLGPEQVDALYEGNPRAFLRFAEARG